MYEAFHKVFYRVFQMIFFYKGKKGHIGCITSVVLEFFE